jgi:hypothetical protein
MAMATTGDADAKMAQLRVNASTNQQLQETEATLDKMHLLLKQLQASAAAKATKDPATKANIEMWGLMIEQLDKQLNQLKAAAREREALEARRNALYKQADEKAALAAKTAQAQAQSNQAVSTAGTASATPVGVQAAPAQAPQTQTPAPSSGHQ